MGRGSGGGRRGRKDEKEGYIWLSLGLRRAILGNVGSQLLLLLLAPPGAGLEGWVEVTEL